MIFYVALAAIVGYICGKTDFFKRPLWGPESTFNDKKGSSHDG